MHSCPQSGANFIFTGRCPHRECWFNVTTKHASGCSRICLSDKDSVSHHDLAFLVSKPAKEMQETVEAGRAKIQAWFALFDAIDSSIETAPYRCQECGIGKPTSGNCLNTLKCDKRKNLLKTLTNFPQVIEVYGNILPHQAYYATGINIRFLELLGMRPLRRLYVHQWRLLHPTLGDPK